MDDLGPFEDGEISADIPINMNAPAVGNSEMAVDGAADIHFAAIDNGDVPGNGPPQIERLGDDLVAIERAAFFAHGETIKR